MMRTFVFLALFALSLASCSASAASRVIRTSSTSSGTTAAAPSCGSCSAPDELKLQEACVPAPPPNEGPSFTENSSAFPLGCAGAAAPSTTRHDDLGTGSRRSPSSSTLCVHRASTQAYDGVVPLQDGSGLLLCWRRNGQIWLGEVHVDPTGAGGSVLRVGGEPLVDIGTLVSQDAAARGRGLVLAGVAVHYATGRLFVSYYTTIAPDGGSALLVVDQLSSASWTWSGYDEANRPGAAQATTTRVFSMALPDQAEPLPRSSSGSYYGGQILFRPNNADPFLYLVTGPAQSDSQLQAKILRFRVGEDMPSGNAMVTPLDAQVYAAGLGIPRRCAFDADKPQDLYCAIVMTDQELVYLISDSDSDSDSDGPSSSATPPGVSPVVAHKRPTPGTPPSLVGGLLYRAYADDTLTGSYIYMERAEVWQTVASPTRNYAPITRNLRVACSAATTASPCRGGDFVGGGVTSFGEDADKNALLLAPDGVYMVVAPSLCGTPDDDNNTAVAIRNWVIGVVAGLVAALAAYGAYKCSNNNNQTNNQDNNSGNINNGNIIGQQTIFCDAP